MRPRRGKEAKKKQQGRPRGAQKGARGAQKWSGQHRGDFDWTIFLAPVPPKGLEILEKAAMLAADWRLQDWKDWRLRI